MHSSNTKLPRIVMWHGGRQWDGAADIHPGRKSRNERAPGIHCTTHFLSAQKNARGDGQVRKLELEPRLLLESAAIPIAEVESFVRKQIPKRAQVELLTQLRAASGRRDLASRVLVGEAPHCLAESILNLCVEADLAHGARGLALAALFLANGIDASFESAEGNEVLGVIFNPACIKSNVPVEASEVPAHMYELPDPRSYQGDDSAPS
ncbi:hypothetical protein [Pseudomonas aeruginosa]|uniref:hypothetical protein n=1 Tax=Pseudomonas aeruginosa TaxID=287 RepID=UPI000939870B|nr:hypothetical protein [Pseudomonas aeruginosa]